MLPATFSLLFAFTFSFTYFSIYVQPQKLNLTTRDEDCYGFEANDDLYGLGVRLGVYLQWIASWIANSLNPKVARSLNDVNSIFVFALVCNTLLASQSLWPVEIFIMMLMFYGYILAGLSILGVRMRLLNRQYLPVMAEKISRIARSKWNDICTDFESIKQALVAYWRNIRNHKQTRPRIRVSQGEKWSRKHLWQAWKDLVISVFLKPASQGIVVSLQVASSLKFDLFSWAGVLWRILIVSTIHGCSITFWWGGWTPLPTYDDCISEVYFFGNRNLEEWLTTVFKVLTLILGVPVFVLCLVAFQFLLYISAFLWAYALYSIPAGRGISITPEWERRLGYVQRSLALHFFRGLIWNPLAALLDGFMHALDAVRPDPQYPEKHNSLALRRALEALISLFTGTEEEQAQRDTVLRREKALWVTCQTLTVITIVCFVLFIENTISSNQISNAYIVGSTNQLIPLIVGIASFLGALCEVLVRLLRRGDQSPQPTHFEFVWEGGMITKMKIVQASAENSELMEPWIGGLCNY